MDRQQVYTGEIPRSFDFLRGWQGAVENDGAIAGAAFGGGSWNGTGGNTRFGVSPLLTLDATGVQVGITAGVSGANTPSYSLLTGFQFQGISGFNLTVGPGLAFVLAAADNVGNILNNGGTSTGYGDINPSSEVITHACQLNTATTLAAVSGAPGSGVIRWFLISVRPTQTDTTDGDDPNIAGVGQNAILPYYNSANPNTPLAGPGGTNPPTQQPTARNATASLVVITADNSSATVPPNTLEPASTDIPLFLGYVQHTDVALNSAHLWYCGLGTSPQLTGTVPVGGNVAPFIRGLTHQHHLGVVGSAPQIDGGVEWKPLSKVSNNGQQLYNVLDLYVYENLMLTADNKPAGGTSPTIPTFSLVSPYTNTDFPTAQVDTGSSESAGSITLTAKTGGVTVGSNTAIFTVTNPTGRTPRLVILSAINAGAGQVIAGNLGGSANYVFISLTTPGAWTFTFTGNAGGFASATTYKFGFLAIY